MPTEKQKQYRNKWDAANMTVLGCKVRKDRAEEFKAACKAAGTTPNAVFNDAIKMFVDSVCSDEEIMRVLKYIDDFVENIDGGDSYWIAPSGEMFHTDVGYGVEFWEQVSGYLKSKHGEQK